MGRKKWEENRMEKFNYVIAIILGLIILVGALATGDSELLILSFFSLGLVLAILLLEKREKKKNQNKNRFRVNSGSPITHNTTGLQENGTIEKQPENSNNNDHKSTSMTSVEPVQLANLEKKKDEKTPIHQEEDSHRTINMSFSSLSQADLQPECSVYEYIKKHTRDGCLPEDFQIPWIRGGWAPGAQDGMLLYHMSPLLPDPAREQKILRALMMMSSEESGDYLVEIFNIFEEIDAKTSIIRLFDEIIRILTTHQADLCLENLLNFGDWLICNGVSLLSVKLGLTIIAPFTVPFVEEVMMEFGVYDEWFCQY